MMSLEKKLLKKLRSAICDFNMIQEGETIILGVSGGKDSMVLGYLLSKYRKYTKEKFNVKAIYIFKDFLIDCDIRFEEKKKYFEEVLDIPLERVVLSLPKESKIKEGLGQSCQWCAYSRRIGMFKLCEKYGATKIMYGHHMDDIVVTTYMNMIQGRNLKMMPVKNKMNLSNTTFIRPMAYMREKDILKLAQINEIPFSGCNCPIGENGMRNKIKKQIIWENEKILPNYTENMFWAFIKDFKAKYEKDGYSM